MRDKDIQANVERLAERCQMETTAVESLFEQLWGEVGVRSGDSPHSVFVRNLIYATEKIAGDTATEELVARLALAEPSRTIFLRIGSEESLTEQPMRAAIYRRTTTAEPTVYSEIIEICVTENNIPAVVSLLLSLRLPGLPTTLIWDNSLAPDHALLPKIAAHVERVIVSVIPPCGAATSLRKFLDLRNQLGLKTATADVTETMYRPWLSTIAKFFTDQSKAVHSLELRCANDKITAEMLYVLAGTAVSLSWTAHSVSWRKGEFSVSFSSGQQAQLSAVPSLLRSEIEIVYETAAGLQREIIPEPPMEIRWEELLRMQLQIREQDPIREKMLERLTEYLDALETPANFS